MGWVGDFVTLGNDVWRAEVLPPWEGVAVQESQASVVLSSFPDPTCDVSALKTGIAVEVDFSFFRQQDLCKNSR